MNGSRGKYGTNSRQGKSLREVKEKGIIHARKVLNRPVELIQKVTYNVVAGEKNGLIKLTGSGRFESQEYEL